MSQPPLLPSDHYLMQVLAEAGVEITEAEWREFKAEVRRRAASGPQPAVVAGLETLAIVSIVLTVVSIGLTIVASFFKPRASNNRPAQLQSNQGGADNVSNIRRYSPRYGFDALQDPATIGTTIPLVYALRENTASGTVGGVRVNLPLLWSQITSLGGSQLLRAIFLISEGRVTELDGRNFAIGNNSISSYDLNDAAANSLGSRLTVYFRGDGGRIRSADRLLGRSAANDTGNSENQGGPDVFSIRHSGRWTSDFSSAQKPSTQTSFGIISLLGNNLGFRVNPSIRPTVNAQLVPKGDEGDGKVKCPVDNVSTVARLKYSANFSTRSGLISGSVAAVGSSITYLLDNSSDADTEFAYPARITDLSWSIRADARNNPFKGFSIATGNSGARIADADLEGLLQLSAIRVTEEKTYEATVTFNAENATYYFDDIEDGSYDISYNIVFIGKDTSGTVAEEVERGFTVRANVRTSYTFNYEAGGEYINPSLVSLGEGSYVLSGGSFTPGGTFTYDTVKVVEFAPTSSTFSISYSKKEPAIEKCGDVASAVSSRQKAWDDAIVVGDLYKIGSALAVCTSRDPADSLFESDGDTLPVGAGSGQAIRARFTAVRPGAAELTSLATLRARGTESGIPRATATSNPHVYRIALANITTTRPCRVVEIGLRSTLGVRINGLCNFKDALTYDRVNGRACRDYENDKVEKGKILRVDIFQSGAISTSEERFSFFRISYREAGTSQGFTELAPLFGVRCITQQSAYNSIRFNMGATKRWEFRFEPITGWEIRSGVASGSLELIDNKLQTDRFINSGGISIACKGTSLPRNKEAFALNSVRRSDGSEVGINFTDEDSYLDAWGKLAEDFVYEEARSSVSGSPEHEIVYVNEIVENVAQPLYDNLAIVGLNIRSSIEFQQFSQFSAYVTKGIQCRRLLQGMSRGPTHLFPDILLDLLTNKRYGKGDLIPDELIDIDSFVAAAQWCQSRGYYYDGAITTRQNLRQWAADVAATHLLNFGESGGKFFLRPAFGGVSVKSLFTAGNIREGSFKHQHLEAEDRRPIQVSVRWREERPTSDPTNPGLFPLEREILVREAGTPDTAPIESIDMSDYCTSRQHAIDAAKYVIRRRRLNTSVIRFETTYEGVMSSLSPSDYIRVPMDTSVYEEFRNGVVTPSGQLVATQDLPDGTHAALLWNGDNNRPPYEGSITVFNAGQSATPAGVVFTIKRPGTEARTYEVASIEGETEGYFAIEAIHTPMVGGDTALSAGFDSNGNWIIQE